MLLCRRVVQIKHWYHALLCKQIIADMTVVMTSKLYSLILCSNPYMLHEMEGEGEGEGERKRGRERACIMLLNQCAVTGIDSSRD